MIPQPEGREALTSYQLQEASSHPASLQGHNSSERHIIHSAPHAAPLSLSCSKLQQRQAWRMSHHTQPLQEATVSHPKRRHFPKNWVFTRKNTRSPHSSDFLAACPLCSCLQEVTVLQAHCLTAQGNATNQDTSHSFGICSKH